MLNLAGGIRVTCFHPEPLHPSVAGAVEEDDKTLDKLCGGNVIPVSNRNPIPRPTKFGEGAQEASKRDESIAPKNPTLNEMGEADIDVISPTSTGINNDASKQLDKAGKDQKSFQGGENGGPKLAAPGPVFICLGNDVLKRVIRMNGIVTSMESTGHCGAVRGGRLGGPFNRLSVFFIVKADRFGRGARALRLPGGIELVRVGNYTLQLGLFILFLVNVHNESGVLGTGTREIDILAESDKVPER